MRINTYILSLICLFFGFITAYLFFISIKDEPLVTETTRYQDSQSGESNISSPFTAIYDDKTGLDRLAIVEKEINLIKQQLSQIESEIISKDLSDDPDINHSRTGQIDSRPPSLLQRRLYQRSTLLKGGVDPAQAEEIVRKKNKIELKRLELQDRAKRNGYLNTRQYFDEMEAINQQDFTLREVLGDDQYDDYLFSSKQNNRIKIASVMLGSAAEQVGIQKGDILLSYDNRRMFDWQELKDATAEGQLGDYVSVSIDRNGEVYSFSIPRGPLGVQLGATRSQPY